MDTFLQAQIALVLALQQLSGLTGAMKFFTFLASEEFFLALVPLVYLCLDVDAGARLVLLLLLGEAVNGTFKLIFHLPRPYWLDARVQKFADEPTYGLPSGHTQRATTIWFLFAKILKRPWAWVGAAVLVLAISISRIYLGVHFPSDIVAGWILGGLVLVIYLKVEPRAKVWLNKIGFWGQMGVALGVALVIILAAVAARAMIAGVADPEAWGSFTELARSLEGAVAIGGAFLGAGTGLAMMRRWACFSAGGPLVKRAVRFAIGLISVGVVYLGLRAIFPTQPEALGLTLRFIRYGLLTWVVSFAVPWLALKLKLAEPA